jgi:hypothetical protein
MSDSIEAKCPTCAKRRTVPATAAGKQARCPCGAVFAIPAASSEPIDPDFEPEPKRPTVDGWAALLAWLKSVGRGLARAASSLVQVKEPAQAQAQGDAAVEGSAAEPADAGERKPVPVRRIIRGVLWGVTLLYVIDKYNGFNSAIAISRDNSAIQEAAIAGMFTFHVITAYVVCRAVDLGFLRIEHAQTRTD